MFYILDHLGNCEALEEVIWYIWGSKEKCEGRWCDDVVVTDPAWNQGRWVKDLGEWWGGVAAKDGLRSRGGRQMELFSPLLSSVLFSECSFLSLQTDFLCSPSTLGSLFLPSSLFPSLPASVPLIPSLFSSFQFQVHREGLPSLDKLPTLV